MGTLYLVATPIGNLEDITLRALRVLREVSLIAAEDTRTTRKLLARHGIRNRLLSYNEHNMAERTGRILKALEDADVALVSEAGTPAISDPGYELVTAAIEAGLEVSPIPGPSAVVAALAVSGLQSREFTFLGFLPRRQTERAKLLESVASLPCTLVAFESPYRLRHSLEVLLDALGDRRIAVCRELTKMHEEVYRGSMREALEHFSEPRGEFTLVVAGADPPELPGDESVISQLRALKSEGASARDAVAETVRSTGRPKRDVYRLWLGL